MFLLLNAIVASLDGLIIGISLRLSNIKITKSNISTIFIGNLLIYFFFLFLYKHFQLTFMTKNITTILYLILGIHSIYDKDSYHPKEKKLHFINCLFITLSHSLDGTIISLSFVYNYKLIHIALIFSFMSLIILLIGYYFAKFFKTNKESYISALLFFTLGIINLFL